LTKLDSPTEGRTPLRYRDPAQLWCKSYVAAPRADDRRSIPCKLAKSSPFLIGQEELPHVVGLASYPHSPAGWIRMWLVRTMSGWLNCSDCSSSILPIPLSNGYLLIDVLLYIFQIVVFSAAFSSAARVRILTGQSASFPHRFKVWQSFKLSLDFCVGSLVPPALLLEKQL